LVSLSDRVNFIRMYAYEDLPSLLKVQGQDQIQGSSPKLAVGLDKQGGRRNQVKGSNVKKLQKADGFFTNAVCEESGKQRV
jgi:hypothetical protein